jgi:hypothetical protein
MYDKCMICAPCMQLYGKRNNQFSETVELSVYSIQSATNSAFCSAWSVRSRQVLLETIQSFNAYWPYIAIKKRDAIYRLNVGLKMEPKSLSKWVANFAGFKGGLLKRWSQLDMVGDCFQLKYSTSKTSESTCLQWRSFRFSEVAAAKSTSLSSWRPVNTSCTL